MGNLTMMLTFNFQIDLEKLQKNLEDDVYQSRDQFKRDLQRIFENARTYNQQETIYYKYANQLEALVRPMLERLKEVDHENRPEKKQKPPKHSQMSQPMEVDGDDSTKKNTDSKTKKNRKK